jgi:phosphopantetheinyl transferase (holo-ACP synthase)
LRLYQYGKKDSSAFVGALIDYIGEAGLDMPGSLILGLPPEILLGFHGKPYFSEPELSGVCFSRSHTLGCEIVCFSDMVVGVDCESILGRGGRVPDFLKIAHRYFTLDEQEYIAAGSAALERFFEVWTAKEAYVKFTGRGFAEGFLSFSVFCLEDAEVWTGRIPGAPHIVCSVCTGRGGMRDGLQFRATQGDRGPKGHEALHLQLRSLVLEAGNFNQSFPCKSRNSLRSDTGFAGGKPL